MILFENFFHNPFGGTMPGAALAIDAHGSRFYQRRDEALRGRLPSEQPDRKESGKKEESGYEISFGIEFNAEREDPSWNDMEDGE